MNSQGSGPFQKTCLLTLFQALIIGIVFTFISMNSSFQTATNLEIKCMTLSDSHKLCISLFEKNLDNVPPNSPVQITSLHNNHFKVLQFRQTTARLKSNYQNQYQEYFQLVNYNQEINSINNVQMDTQVKEIREFLNIEKAQFTQQALNTTSLRPSSGVAVMYFLVENHGPMIPEPQVSASHQSISSINLNIKVCIIICTVGIAILLGWSLYQAVRTLKDNSRPPNESLCDNPHINKVNRPSRFLWYFGLGNIIVFTAANKLWSSFGLNKVIEMFGIDTNIMTLIEQQASHTDIDTFPEWLMLGFFLYLIFQKYCGWGNIKLVLLSAFISGLIYLVPSAIGQMLFELLLIGLGLLLTATAKPTVKDGNKFTVSMLFTALNLVLMILAKRQSANFQSDEKDFVLRLIYNNIFMFSNILALFYADGLVTSKTDRKYIPYEEYAMEEETEFDEHSQVQHAQKI